MQAFHMASHSNIWKQLQFWFFHSGDKNIFANKLYQCELNHSHIYSFWEVLLYQVICCELEWFYSSLWPVYLTLQDCLCIQLQIESWISHQRIGIKVTWTTSISELWASLRKNNWQINCSKRNRVTYSGGDGHVGCTKKEESEYRLVKQQIAPANKGHSLRAWGFRKECWSLICLFSWVCIHGWYRHNQPCHLWIGRNRDSHRACTREILHTDEQFISHSELKAVAKFCSVC